MKYIRKAIEIDAVQWTGENIEEIHAFDEGVHYVAGVVKVVPLHGLIMRADVGDWILRDPEGSCYVCKDSVFVASYHGPWDQDEKPAEPEKPAPAPGAAGREHAENMKKRNLG